jgi:folate-dependent phosphoribosylglycinamide formyltransferase PurN
MKIVILTQDDHFFIPQNINKIVLLKDVEVSLIAVLNTKDSLMNRKCFFIKGYGLVQSVKMGMLLYKYKLEDLLDSIFHFRLFKVKRSIKAVAAKNKIPFQIVDNPNNSEFIKQLKEISLDLIVSFSAPCVFNQSLLSLPELGCINLHCSRLPYYAGLMPNFWVLFNRDSKAGATVHYMDDRIDTGKIICQGEFDIPSNITMFELIRQTKKLGGQLVVEAIIKLQVGTLKLTENKSDEGSYHSWPSIREMIRFRKNGGRFI